MGEVKRRQTPRAMIHKRIIDAAAARPDAALAEIAADVPGASTDLVERVLDEYGDPAAREAAPTKTGSTDQAGHTPAGSATPPDEPTAQTPTTGEPSPADSATASAQPATDETTAIGALRAEADADTGTDADVPGPVHTDSATVDSDDTPREPAVDLDALTEKRHETLRAINAYPEASQRDLAAKLGVTAATISQRVSAIDGFQWADRSEFVADLFEETREEFDAAFDLASKPTDPDTPTTTQEEASPADTPRPDSGPVPYETASDGGQSEYARELEALHDRLDDLEAALEERNGHPTVADPELLSKVLHACLDAESISTEEEHRIIEQLLP